MGDSHKIQARQTLYGNRQNKPLAIADKKLNMVFSMLHEKPKNIEVLFCGCIV